MALLRLSAADGSPTRRGPSMATLQRSGRTPVAPLPEVTARPIRVAMIGQKGVPATFGGIEHHVEEIGRLLAQRDDVEVTVYCRKSYDTHRIDEHLGMRLVWTPTFGSRHLDAISHSVSSTIHALTHGADVVHYHAIGPGLVAPLARYFSRAKVVLTVHGLDHERGKWKGGLASAVLGLAHRISGRVPDRVVTVSKDLEQHYATEFHCNPAYVPNGVPAPRRLSVPERLREEFGLEAGRYVLFVGRMVPEKRPDLLIEAMRVLPHDVKVAMVGGSSFTDEYMAHIRDLAARDPRVVLPGYLYGDDLAALYANAAMFVQPSDLEGLPLTLLEAVSYGVPVLASDIAPHEQILASCTCPAHRTFRAGDQQALVTALAEMLDAQEDLRAVATAEASELVAPYQWDSAAEDLAEIYRELTGRPSATTPDPRFAITKA